MSGADAFLPVDGAKKRKLEDQQASNYAAFKENLTGEKRTEAEDDLEDIPDAAYRVITTWFGEHYEVINATCKAVFCRLFTSNKRTVESVTEPTGL